MIEKQINERPAISMPEVDDEDRIRKEMGACAKNIRKYEKGDSLFAWKQSFYNSVSIFGRHLMQMHLCELARQTMGSSVRKDLEASRLRTAHKLTDVMTQLDSIFAPREYELDIQLDRITFTAQNSAQQFIERIKKVYASCNAAYPSEIGPLRRIIAKFTGDYKLQMENKFEHLLARNSSPSLADIEQIALQVDSTLQGMRVLRSRPGTAVATAGSQPADDDYDGSYAHSEEQYQGPEYPEDPPANNRGRGRNGGRGRGRFQNRGRNNRGRGWNNHANNNGNGDSGASGPDMNVAQWTPEGASMSFPDDAIQMLAQQAERSEGRRNRRGYKPEQIVHDPGDASPAELPTQSLPESSPAAADVPSQTMNMPGRIARQMQRLGPTAGQQLKATPVLTNLGNLCHLVNSCNMQSGAKLLEQVFLEPAIAADGMQYLLCVPDKEVPVAGQLATVPDEIHSQPSASVLPESTLPDNAPKAAAPKKAAAPVIHATANHLTVATSAGHTYSDAAGSVKETVQVYDVSMPSVSGRLAHAGENIRRNFAMDTGCSASCISESAFKRDQNRLLQYGRLHTMATPTKVKMLGKQVSHAAKVIKHARVYIGEAYYVTAFFVVPDCAFEYVLSAAWMTVYSATPCFRQGEFEIGVPKGTWNPQARFRPRNGYQRVPMTWKGRQLYIPVLPANAS